MKKTVSLILAMLLLLLFAACGESAKDAQEAIGRSEDPSAEGEDLSGAAPEDENTPSLPDTPAEPDETAAPPDGPAVEPDASLVNLDGPATAPDAPAAEPSSVRLGETPDAGHEYLDKLIFLGDSTTYGIGYYYNHGFSEELVPPSQIWTPANGTITLCYYATVAIVDPETGEELLIRDIAERTKPEYLVITLGVNGIAFMDEEWFVRDYTDLVETVKAVSPETKIILNSIYPIGLSYPYQKDINNEKIRTANGWIEQIAEDTGVRFLYSHEAVVGEDGNLPEGSSNGDGLHLTGEALTTVMHYIRTHAYQ